MKSMVRSIVVITLIVIVLTACNAGLPEATSVVSGSSGVVSQDTSSASSINEKDEDPVEEPVKSEPVVVSSSEAAEQKPEMSEEEILSLLSYGKYESLQRPPLKEVSNIQNLNWPVINVTKEDLLPDKATFEIGELLWKKESPNGINVARAYREAWATGGIAISVYINNDDSAVFSEGIFMNGYTLYEEYCWVNDNIFSMNNGSDLYYVEEDLYEKIIMPYIFTIYPTTDRTDVIEYEDDLYVQLNSAKYYRIAANKDGTKLLYSFCANLDSTIMMHEIESKVWTKIYHTYTGYGRPSPLSFAWRDNDEVVFAGREVALEYAELPFEQEIVRFYINVTDSKSKSTKRLYELDKTQFFDNCGYLVARIESIGSYCMYDASNDIWYNTKITSYPTVINGYVLGETDDGYILLYDLENKIAYDFSEIQAKNIYMDFDYVGRVAVETLSGDNLFYQVQ